MNALFSLLAESLGGLPFHTHFSFVFFFCSFIFLGCAFFVACVLPVIFCFAGLLVVPQCSFFKELILVVMAMIFS